MEASNDFANERGQEALDLIDRLQGQLSTADKSRSMVNGHEHSTLVDHSGLLKA